MRAISIFFIGSIFFCSCMTDAACKRYIIAHQSEIYLPQTNYPESFSIKKYAGNYYQNITIKLTSDSAYTVIMWGNRNSWLWNFKYDKILSIDVAYNNYLGIATKRDFEILQLLNSKINSYQQLPNITKQTISLPHK